VAVGYQRGRARPVRVATANLRLSHDDNGLVDETAAPVGSSVTSAHLAWDEAWRELASTGEESPWRRPEPKVLASIPLLKRRGVRRVLDLGTGMGRHTMALAANGFDVWGVDASRSGVQHVGAEATAVGLGVALVVGTFLELPFPASSFDFVLAWNVLYHGDSASTGRAIAEVARVLRPRGLYLGTMLSKRNAQYGLGREISPNTFVQDGSLGDRRHPHLYCNAAELLALHPDFEPLALEDRDQGDSRLPAQYHWEFLMEKEPHRA
jgi:tellurite methyltransferase